MSGMIKHGQFFNVIIAEVERIIINNMCKRGYFSSP